MEKTKVRFYTDSNKDMGSTYLTNDTYLEIVSWVQSNNSVTIKDKTITTKNISIIWQFLPKGVK